MMYGFRYISSHVERNVIRHSLREACTDFLHFGTYIFSDLHGIGPRKHINIHNSRIAGIDSTLGVVGLGFQRDFRNILQTDERTVTAGADNDLFELFH